MQRVTIVVVALERFTQTLLEGTFTGMGHWAITNQLLGGRVPRFAYKGLSIVIISV